MSDPKADEIPFDFERILLIEEYLQQLSNILDKSKDNLSESQISIIEEVQNVLFKFRRRINITSAKYSYRTYI